MSLSTLFSRKSSSNESSSRGNSKDMMTRGREIVRGRLLMRKGSSSKKSIAEVVVYCAPHDCSQAGQMEIFEEVNRTYQKPKKVISLTEVDNPGVQGGSPCSSLSSSPGSAAFGSSPSSSTGLLYPFQVLLKSNEVIEFFTELPEDQRQWVKRLSLLFMFPNSPIPEEPVNNPIKDSFRAKLDPAEYRADSVWAVYILPEEVGSRVNALGVHVVALRSRRTNNQPGQLDIISLADPHNPIVTWDRDKMRRTGCLGNMVFIEIGRRCRGGPGLVWMYAGPKETAALRETLHTFLFKGDGRAVPISTQQQNTHSEQQSNRVSFDSGVVPSYPKRSSSSSSSYHQSPSINTPQRQQSTDSQASDSGLPPSYPKQSGPSSSSFHQQSPSVYRRSSVDPQLSGADTTIGGGGHPSSPYNHQQPPPVDLNSHPSRRSSFRSSSSMYENVDTDSGFSSYNSSSRRGSTMTEMTDGEQFILEDTEEEMNGSSTSRGEDPAFSRHTTFSTPKSTSHYQVPPTRSHTVSSPRPYLHSGNYEKMINPKANNTSHYQEPVSDEQYVQMKPAPSRSNSMRSYSDSPPTTKQLHPISEGREINKSSRSRDQCNYENTSFHSSAQEHQFEYYAPKYENMENFRDRRSSSFSQDKYARQSSSSNGNVRLVETPSPPVIIPTPP